MEKVRDGCRAQDASCMACMRACMMNREGSESPEVLFFLFYFCPRLIILVAICMYIIERIVMSHRRLVVQTEKLFGPDRFDGGLIQSTERRKERCSFLAPLIAKKESRKGKKVSKV